MIDEMINPVRHFFLRRTLRARYYAAKTEFATATYLLVHRRRMQVDQFDAFCAFNLARASLDQSRADWLETSNVEETSHVAPTVRAQPVAKIFPFQTKR